MKQRILTLGLKIVVSTRSTRTENPIFKGGAMKNIFEPNKCLFESNQFFLIKKKQIIVFVYGERYNLFKQKFISFEQIFIVFKDTFF